MMEIIVNYITYLITGIKGWETMKLSDLFLYRGTYLNVEFCLNLFIMVMILWVVVEILIYIVKDQKQIKEYLKERV